MVNTMVDKDLYIQQLTYNLRKKETKIKDLKAQNPQLVLKTAVVADELEKMYAFLKKYNLYETYKVFKENNYV